MINMERIKEILQQVGGSEMGWEHAAELLEEEMTQGETEADYRSEPPNGFLFSKSDIAGFCITAYDEGHKEGHSDAYRAVFNHLGDHDTINDLAECLHGYMRDRLGIRFEPKRDSMTALLEGLVSSGIPQLQIISLGDLMRMEGQANIETIEEQEARHAEANARLRQKMEEGIAAERLRQEMLGDIDAADQDD